MTSPPQRRRVVRRSRIAPRWRIRLYQVAVIAAFFGIWEYASDRWIRELWISAPSLILEQTIDWFSSGYIYRHIVATLQVAGVGLILGAVAGIALGLIIGLQRRLSLIIDPIVSAAYTLPRVALLPLLLVWFGFGFRPLVALVAVMIFFVLFFNVRSGVQDVDQDLIASVRVMGATRAQVVRMVILPSIVPFVLAAMMISLPYALVGAIVGEIFIGSKGLGFLIVSNTSALELTKTFTACGVVTVLGLVSSQIVARHGPRLLGRSGDLDAARGAGL